LRCAGKKTGQFDKLIASLLQAEALARTLGLANPPAGRAGVQFCA